MKGILSSISQEGEELYSIGQISADFFYAKTDLQSGK